MECGEGDMFSGISMSGSVMMMMVLLVGSSGWGKVVSESSVVVGKCVVLVYIYCVFLMIKISNICSGRDGLWSCFISFYFLDEVFSVIGEGGSVWSDSVRWREKLLFERDEDEYEGMEWSRGWRIWDFDEEMCWIWMFGVEWFGWMMCYLVEGGYNVDEFRGWDRLLIDEYCYFSVRYCM